MSFAYLRFFLCRKLIAAAVCTRFDAGTATPAIRRFVKALGAFCVISVEIAAPVT